ncbi:MAG: DUF6745 domain-containing protein [Bacteroidota bacterium]
MQKINPIEIIKNWSPPADIVNVKGYLAELSMSANDSICNYILEHGKWYNKNKFRNTLKKVIVCDSPLSAQLAANHIAIENKECNLYEKGGDFGCARTINNALKVKSLYKYRQRSQEMGIRKSIFSEAFKLIRKCIFSPNTNFIPGSVFENAIKILKQNGFDLVSEQPQRTYNHYNWGINGIHQELLNESFDVLTYPVNFKGKGAVARKNLFNFIKNVFDFIELKEVWIVSRLPVSLHLDEMNRLHHPSRPAVEWSDGFSLYYWKGVCVPSDLILKPDEVTAEFLNSLSNAEVRRAACEILGNVRFAELLELVTVDEDQDEAGNPLLLLRSRFEDNIIEDHLYYLSVVCPSSSRKYFIKVPPSKNVWSSLAWTFGKDKDD